MGVVNITCVNVVRFVDEGYGLAVAAEEAAEKVATRVRCWRAVIAAEVEGRWCCRGRNLGYHGRS
jgi:hypothetical protein